LNFQNFRLLGSVVTNIISFIEDGTFIFGIFFHFFTIKDRKKEKKKVSGGRRKSVREFRNHCTFSISQVQFFEFGIRIKYSGYFTIIFVRDRCVQVAGN